jgi:hypothetical protein
MRRGIVSWLNRQKSCDSELALGAIFKTNLLEARHVQADAINMAATFDEPQRAEQL